MRINLLDIGEEGHEFAFKMGEERDVDKSVLEILPQLKNYKFRIFIQKTGDIFTAVGEYTLENEDICSLCAYDISMPVKNKFTEYLMNESKADQKGHAPHNGLNIESEQEVTFVQGYEFDLADFVSELFSLNVPAYPKCLDQQACQERQKENKKYYVENQQKGHSAFSVLEKLKK